MYLQPRLCPGPRWGSLQRSPRPSSWIWRAGRGKEGEREREGRGNDGERGKGCLPKLAGLDPPLC